MIQHNHVKAGETAICINVLLTVCSVQVAGSVYYLKVVQPLSVDLAWSGD